MAELSIEGPGVGAARAPLSTLSDPAGNASKTEPGAPGEAPSGGFEAYVTRFTGTGAQGHGTETTPITQALLTPPHCNAARSPILASFCRHFNAVFTLFYPHRSPRLNSSRRVRPRVTLGSFLKTSPRTSWVMNAVLTPF